MEKVYPNITVVNDQDEVIGTMQLMEAIEKGLTRRVSCVLIFNELNEILVQRRAPDVLFPNLLDFSAAGHVDEGESYETAARRELKEELHLTVTTLELITPPFKTPQFFSAVYKVVLEKNQIIAPNAEEVAEIIWMPFSDFQNKIQSDPEQFTSSIVEAWPHLRDKLVL